MAGRIRNLLAIKGTVAAVAVIVVAWSLGDGVGALAAGALDTSFGTNGVATGASFAWGAALIPHMNRPKAISVQPNGDIVVVGFGHPYLTGKTFVGIERFLPDGTLDASFGANGGFYYDGGQQNGIRPSSATIDAAGRIIVVGDHSDNASGAIARFTPDGLPDATFNGTGFISLSNMISRVVAVLPDGSLAIDGSPAPSGTGEIVTKFKADGSQDMNFGTGGTVTVGASRSEGVSLAADSQGNIFDLNLTQNDSPIPPFKLSKLTATGAIASAFGANGSVQLLNDGPFAGATVQLDHAGNVLVNGGRQNADGSLQAHEVVRFTPSGNLDTSFGTNGIATASSLPAGTTWPPSNFGITSSLAFDNSGNIFTVGPSYDAAAAKYVGIATRLVGTTPDTAPPVVTNVAFSSNPKSVTETSVTLSAQVVDIDSGVASAEYYDPVQQVWTPMTVTGSTASAVISTPANSYPANMYPFQVRATDAAGNVSQATRVNLDIYNPTGGSVAGHGAITPNGPSSNPGDTLPAQTGNNVKANFDFSVGYPSANATVPTGSSLFTWGSNCNQKNNDCFTVTISDWQWLIVAANNTATFQGTASVAQGSHNLGAAYPARITTYDGRSTNTPSHYLLQVFQAGSDPDAATPLYQASGNLDGGQITTHK